MSLKIETNILNGKIPDKINYQTNLKIFLHELLNPLNIISNCAELIDHSNSNNISIYKYNNTASRVG